jgi:hypothetical protein
MYLYFPDTPVHYGQFLALSVTVQIYRDIWKGVWKSSLYFIISREIPNDIHGIMVRNTDIDHIVTKLIYFSLKTVLHERPLI